MVAGVRGQTGPASRRLSASWGPAGHSQAHAVPQGPRARRALPLRRAQHALRAAPAFFPSSGPQAPLSYAWLLQARLSASHTHALRCGSKGPIRPPPGSKATSQKPTIMTPSPGCSAGSRALGAGFRRKFLPRGRSTGPSWSRLSLADLANRGLASCRVRRPVLQLARVIVARATAS